MLVHRRPTLLLCRRQAAALLLPSASSGSVSPATAVDRGCCGQVAVAVERCIDAGIDVINGLAATFLYDGMDTKAITKEDSPVVTC